MFSTFNNNRINSTLNCVFCRRKRQSILPYLKQHMLSAITTLVLTAVFKVTLGQLIPHGFFILFFCPEKNLWEVTDFSFMAQIPFVSSKQLLKALKNWSRKCHLLSSFSPSPTTGLLTEMVLLHSCWHCDSSML